ncbi:hypothetical protein RJT34_30984 [Clitoria ternatea]|uniref:Uncharacterized protein n=1 Tax=Clitoria ternatea TaxID=43366 RepID=A0AAN9I4K1_CLITE
MEGGGSGDGGGGEDRRRETVREIGEGMTRRPASVLTGERKRERRGSSARQRVNVRGRVTGHSDRLLAGRGRGEGDDAVGVVRMKKMLSVGGDGMKGIDD